MQRRKDRLWIGMEVVRVQQTGTRDVPTSTDVISVEREQHDFLANLELNTYVPTIRYVKVRMYRRQGTPSVRFIRFYRYIHVR